MAGIGFELKKIFQKKSLFMSIGGYVYATFVTVGPILVCVSLLLILRSAMRGMGVALQEQDLFLASVTYAFMFALVMSSAITMMLSRYLSDMIYSEKIEKILPSAFSSVAIGLIIGAISGVAFYLIADLPILFELLAYVLYQELIALFILMVYISAVKDYKRISFAFVIGMVCGLLTALITIYVFQWEIILSLLLSLVITFFVTLVLIANHILVFFKRADNSYFEFLTYIKKRPQLILINVFYMVSIFIHHVIIWGSPIGIVVADTYHLAPSYDVPAYYAMLTTLPAIIMFVVRTETSFYGHYRQYIHALAGGGTLEDLQDAAENVTSSMYSELAFVLEVQFMISALCIVAGKFLLPYVGFTQSSYAYFAYLCLGYFLITATYIIASFMLYFDEKQATLRVMTIFLVTHILCVWVLREATNDLYGLGTFLAGFISMVVAMYEVKRMSKSLDYRLYCTQPITNEEEN
jgi:uncharacterized membrane protein